MYSAYNLNKQGDNIKPWCTPFLIWNVSIVPCPVLTVVSQPSCRFLRRQVRWSDISIPLRISHSLFWSTQSKGPIWIILTIFQKSAKEYKDFKGCTVESVIKISPAHVGDPGDTGLIQGLGRFPGEGNGDLLQYSCLENPMDRGAWRAIVHRVTKSWTQLKQLNMHVCL